jgi:hypothetical protein
MCAAAKASHEHHAEDEEWGAEDEGPQELAPPKLWGWGGKRGAAGVTHGGGCQCETAAQNSRRDEWHSDGNPSPQPFPPTRFSFSRSSEPSTWLPSPSGVAE